ncbi:CAP domain-containing protein [Haloferula sp. BvORR071]|uniref:CAP domain-containing protein n=1 Tax=Haloferula sp. BvORR071 TaxID=1396141 RepID=UPI0005543E04|nr:CAP domain-containing protein [Haloferula sp. BvORR071]
MKLRIFSRLLALGLLAATSPLLSSCGSVGGGNHQVVNVPGLHDFGVRLREAANSYRRANGKSTLGRHAGLEEMARQHAEAMARSGVMSHDGAATRYAKASATYQIHSTAENVMRWPVQRGRDPQAMLQSWINSSGHRRSLLDSAYSVTGLGIAQNEQGNIWVTQMFGSKPGTGQGAPGVGRAW